MEWELSKNGVGCMMPENLCFVGFEMWCPVLRWLLVTFVDVEELL